MLCLTVLTASLKVHNDFAGPRKRRGTHITHSYLENYIDFKDDTLSFKIDAHRKNAAKRNRQHAGKKYWEYAQRRVCFLNEQVP